MWVLNFVGCCDWTLIWENVGYLFYLSDIDLNLHRFDLLKWMKLQNWRIAVVHRIYANRLMESINDLLQNILSRHEMSLRDLNQVSIGRDISETSQKHLKSDAFFVTSLRRLKNISKRCLLRNVFKTSQAYLKKDVYFPWQLWDVSKTSLANVFGFSKICHKNGFVWFP